MAKLSSDTKRILEVVKKATREGVDVEIELSEESQTQSHRNSIPRSLSLHLGLSSNFFTIKANSSSHFGGTLIYYGSKKPALKTPFTNTVVKEDSLSHLPKVYEVREEESLIAVYNPTLANLTTLFNNSKKQIVLHEHSLTKEELIPFDPIEAGDGTLLLLPI